MLLKTELSQSERGRFVDGAWYLAFCIERILESTNAFFPDDLLRNLKQVFRLKKVRTGLEIRKHRYNKRRVQALSFLFTYITYCYYTPPSL